MPKDFHKYNLESVPENYGVFHPKVVIGIQKKGPAILIGSHNLTASALRWNHELTGYTVIPLTDSHSKIITQITDFLSDLRLYANSQASKDVIDEFSDFLNKDILPGKNKKVELDFLNSYKKPLIEQVKNRLPKIEKITILAQTHTDNRNWIENFVDTFGGNAEVLIDSTISLSKEVQELYDEFTVNKIVKERKAPVHAKLYIFHSEDGDWILYGSPNFTKKAWSESFEEGGNWETALLLPPTSDFDYRNNLFSKNLSLEIVDSISNLNLSEEKPEDEKEKRIFNVTGIWDGEKVTVETNKPPRNEEVRIEIYDQENELILEKKVELSESVLSIKLEEVEDRIPIYMKIINSKEDNIFLNSDISLQSEEIDRDLMINISSLRRKITNLKRDYPTRTEPDEDILIDPEKWRKKEENGNGEGPPISHKPHLHSNSNYLSNIRDKWKEWIEKREELNEKSSSSEYWLRGLLFRLDLLLEATFFRTLEKKSEKNGKWKPDLIVKTLYNIKNLDRLNLKEIPEDKNLFWKINLSRHSIKEYILSNFLLYEATYEKYHPRVFQNKYPKAYEINLKRFYSLFKVFESLSIREEPKNRKSDVFEKIKVSLENFEDVHAPRSLEEIKNRLERRVEKIQE
ncbi:hypothetical protein AKJ64_00610 [candidate division MSBL1 archaeon SCGC-AAA259E17]|uniref:Uncharacterized protein n=1 Tax=candidate division MSBL1 archaeon SCGC-AAA259E17 TaxID=1698263 RepID=A0A133UH24_9EURY|nr:hypothetical protein AKJ64_00610 [candidate division MSBL1 archaeon SCGC-AAA259E17]